MRSQGGGGWRRRSDALAGGGGGGGGGAMRAHQRQARADAPCGCGRLPGCARLPARRTQRTCEWPRLTSCRMPSTSSMKAPSPTRLASASSTLLGLAHHDICSRQLGDAGGAAGSRSSTDDSISSSRFDKAKNLCRPSTVCWPGTAKGGRREWAHAPGEDIGPIELFRSNRYARQLLG